MMTMLKEVDSYEMMHVRRSGVYCVVCNEEDAIGKRSGTAD